MARSQPEKLDLADALGIDPRTLRNWEKRDGFPVGGTLDQIKEWRDMHGLGKRGSKDLAAVKLDIANQQLVKITRENELAAGRMVSIEELTETAQKVTAIWQARLRGIMETEMPPKLLGLPIAEIRSQIRQSVDRLCEEVKRDIMSCAGKPQ
jgi:transcriptional regulator with XRE-family HTH domain